MMTHPLGKLLQEREGAVVKGIYSCCSANQYVIRAVLRRAKAKGIPALVEATANQVDQNGGYTGMTPEAFHAFLERLALAEGFPLDKLIWGGDHLGPLTWKNKSEAEAMENAETLIAAYVMAGASKIHLDTSMRVAGDDTKIRLPDEVIARRGARLCKVAEEAFARYHMDHPEAPAPVYVIGSEVPIPGGAEENEQSVIVTTPADCEAALAAFQSAFSEAHLEDAWSRTIALVVQPGAEFADESVVEYDRKAALELTQCLKNHPGLVFEGHSTDYQPKQRLREMVEDGIAILKVGPALTFALREGLFALEQIERELYSLNDFPCSRFRDVLEQVMLEDTTQWARYYHGSMMQRRYARAFSYSDRARYYLSDPRVEKAVERLLRNLNAAPIPAALVSQYLPQQYRRVREGTLQPEAEALLLDRIGDQIDDYLYAILADQPPQV